MEELNNMEKIELKMVDGAKEVIVREGDAPEIYQYRGFKYEAKSSQAFIALLQSKAVKENAVVAYTEKRVCAILNDQVIERNQDHVTYAYELSQQVEEWGNILTSNGASFYQKEIVNFFQRREEDELGCLESLLVNLQTFKGNTTIDFESSFDDDNNHTFAVKVATQNGSVEGTTSLPKVILPNIEIFNESGFFQEVEIELEIVAPKSQDDKLVFKLSCPKYDRYLREAVKHEIETIKAGLDGFLIVTGVIY